MVSKIRRMLSEPSIDADLNVPPPATDKEKEAVKKAEIVEEMLADEPVLHRQDQLQIKKLTEEDSYKLEFDLRKAHSLLLRGLSAREVGAEMGIPERQARKLIEELRVRLAAQAQRTNVYELVGRSIAFYDSVRAEAMKLYDSIGDSEKSVYRKLQSMQVALEAESAKNRFLKDTRFFEHAPFESKTKTTERHSAGARTTKEMLDAIVLDNNIETAIQDDSEIVEEVINVY